MHYLQEYHHKLNIWDAAGAQVVAILKIQWFILVLSLIFLLSAH